MSRLLLRLTPPPTDSDTLTMTFTSQIQERWKKKSATQQLSTSSATASSNVAGNPESAEFRTLEGSQREGNKHLSWKQCFTTFKLSIHKIDIVHVNKLLNSSSHQLKKKI